VYSRDTGRGKSRKGGGGAVRRATRERDRSWSHYRPEARAYDWGNRLGSCQSDESFHAPARGEEPCEGDGRGALDVVVEGADLVAVPAAVGKIRSKILLRYLRRCNAQFRSLIWKARCGARVAIARLEEAEGVGVSEVLELNEHTRVPVAQRLAPDGVQRRRTDTVRDDLLLPLPMSLL
jgi:hypothetical protein